MAFLPLVSCFLVLCLSQRFDTPLDSGSLSPLSGTGTQEVGCYRSGEICVYTVIVKLYDIFLTLVSESRLECNTTCSSDDTCVFNESCPVCQESIISDTGSFLVQRNCLEFTSCVDDPRINCTEALIGNYPPAPTIPPTNRPTLPPTTITPTAAPTILPTLSPTLSPTRVPTVAPTVTPTILPTSVPTATPTVPPTLLPTVIPTRVPTVAPTSVPVLSPTTAPTNIPTATPTIPPTLSPTALPTLSPTRVPTAAPTVTPTNLPTTTPTIPPTTIPTLSPTVLPTLLPTRAPTAVPTVLPTGVPTVLPTSVPTVIPTPYAGCESCTFTQGGYNKPLCREEPPVCEIAKSMWRTIRPECLLKACFDRPVSIGVLPGFKATFTTTEAIARFLPASRAPGVLLKNLVNPSYTPAGVFAGQLLVATLNTQFYSPGNLAFSNTCAVINNRLRGMSIASVISLSHRVISGQRSHQFTPAMLTSALSVYNEAFNACNASNRACFVCSPGDIDASDVPETPIVVAAERDDIFYLFLAYFVFLLLFFAIVIGTRNRGYRTK